MTEWLLACLINLGIGTLILMMGFFALTLIDSLMGVIEDIRDRFDR